ncbi:MAG: hypothetical protein WCR34_03105 [Bacilli bacterium]
MKILVSIVWRVCSRRIAKWAGVFTLLICCFTCVGLAQETLASPENGGTNTAATNVFIPSDPLISFINHFPEKFELKFSSKSFLDVGVATTSYRILRDGKNRILQVTSTADRLVQKQTDGAKPQFILVTDEKNPDIGYLCRYDNEYWSISENRITTWTNRNIPEERTNSLTQGIEFIERLLEGPPKISPFFKDAIWSDENHFIVRDKEGNIYVDGEINRDPEGKIKEVITTYKKPEKVNSAIPGTEIYFLRKVWECLYEKDIGVSFFPTTVNRFDITRRVNASEEWISTNKNFSCSFSEFNLNPVITSKDFALHIPPTDTNYTRYWVAGTNIVYEHPQTKQVFRLLNAGETDAMRKKQAERQSNYRRIYIVLAVILTIIIITISIKKKGK